MTKFAITAAALLLATPAYAGGHAASGDAAAGEQAFDRQCVTCHNVVNEDGDVLAGRPNMRTGPSLYGVAGRPIASVEDFRYGPGITQLAETDMVWTEENFVAYLQDPTGWLREATGDDRARSRMSWRVRNPVDAVNIYAYLASLGGDMAAE
ncbi:c-type cytochrome [Roseovarius sp. SYSU LYC5161]|uniref:c-type cytochrome n=1 Tax=Roseovarius halophilus (ex Wu et al. 2025) TaxID=3376060 RepID=UPI00399B5D7D